VKTPIAPPKPPPPVPSSTTKPAGNTDEDENRVVLRELEEFQRHIKTNISHAKAK
jgi:hypothetical protein